jgi:hypothetical protein
VLTAVYSSGASGDCRGKTFSALSDTSKRIHESSGAPGLFVRAVLARPGRLPLPDRRLLALPVLLRRGLGGVQWRDAAGLAWFGGLGTSAVTAPARARGHGA